MDGQKSAIFFSLRSGLNVNIILNILTICCHKVFKLYSTLSVETNLSMCVVCVCVRELILVSALFFFVDPNVGHSSPYRTQRYTPLCLLETIDVLATSANLILF